MTADAIVWTVPGQVVLFDDNDYYQRGTDWPWLDPTLLGDDAIHDLFNNLNPVDLDAPASPEQVTAWASQKQGQS